MLLLTTHSGLVNKVLYCVSYLVFVVYIHIFYSVTHQYLYFTNSTKTNAWFSTHYARFVSCSSVNLKAVSQLHTGQSDIPLFTLPRLSKSWSLFLKIFTNSNHNLTHNRTGTALGGTTKNQRIFILEALSSNLIWTPAVLTEDIRGFSQSL